MKFNKDNIKKLEKKIFTILVLFLSIIVGTYLVVDSYIFSNQLKKISFDNALEKINQRENYLKKYLEDGKIQLYNIKESSFFKEYEKNNSIKPVENLFVFLLNNQKNIMQIRYINKLGNEKIRVERKTISSLPIIVKNKNLQNKSQRDYFLKSKNMKNETVWFSSIELNKENGKIEKPYKSTIRAIMTLQKNNEFDGIIVINYFMDEFFHALMHDSIYNYILVDEDGFSIIHFEEDKSWSKYKNPPRKFDFNNDFISKDLDLPLNKKVTFKLKLNEDYLSKVKYDKFFSKLWTSCIIIFFSIIAIIIISRVLRQLIFELTNYEKYTSLIDENIITSTTDLKGNITFASKAFCQISGYKESELLGKSHNIVRHPDEKASKYEQMWKELINNRIWEGELENISKSGKVYWVKAKIYPNYKNGIKVGYTAIRHDISDKKIIEEISIRDGLTNLYNRKYFTETLPKFVNNAKRNKSLVSFIMIDVDYFKKYNDTYGHQKGDEVLIKISEIFHKSLKRANDYSFRIGGEEFVILFIPKTNKEAIDFAEEIRKSVEALKIIHEGNKDSSFITISLGLVTLKPDTILNAEDLYKKADKLLYKSKDMGRNILISKEI